MNLSGVWKDRDRLLVRLFGENIAPLNEDINYIPIYGAVGCGCVMVYVLEGEVKMGAWWCLTSVLPKRNVVIHVTDAVLEKGHVWRLEGIIVKRR